MGYKRNCELKPEMSYPEGMVRMALGVEYAGADLNGFQKQSSTDNTVQEKLENALSAIATEKISVVCAGRTDAGVHATGQVVHFDTIAIRPSKAWIKGVNTKLPDTIRVLWAKEVGAHFHARFSAGSRSYRYLFHPSSVQSAIFNKQVTAAHANLNFKLMADVSKYLVGRHDFTSFRSSRCQASNPVRTVEAIDWCRRGELIGMEIRANAFLHHMVRNIVGSLIEVGRGRHDPSWLKKVLNARDRCHAGPTAAPYGLYLTEVRYPKEFELPKLPIGPAFFVWDDHSPV